MLRLLLSFCLLTFSSSLLAQFKIGHTSITFTDPSRNNRAIPTEIYYPAEVAGDQAPMATGTFPVISFGHGFVMVWSAYANFWETYVPQGYILCFPKTEGTFSPSHTDFAKDLAFLCTAMEVEKTNPSSLFFEHVQSRYCVMGHSMGGGSTILAYQYNPDLIKCVATFAPANTNPSAIAVAPAVSIPSLTFAASYDCIAPPAQQAQLIFEALDTTACKLYVSLNGASHCQFANANTNCNLGEVISGCSTPPISAATQHELANKILQPWLNTWLKETPGFWAPLQDTIAAGNGFTGINNCKITSGLEAVQNTGLEFRILKNPVLESELAVQFSGSEAILSLEFLVYNASGQLLLRVPPRACAPSEILQIPVASFPSGIYCLVALDKQGQKGVQKFVKH